MNRPELTRLHTLILDQPDLFDPARMWREDDAEGFPVSFGVPGLLAELHDMTWATAHYGMFLTINGRCAGVDMWAANLLDLTDTQARRLFLNTNRHDIIDTLALLAAGDDIHV